MTEFTIFVPGVPISQGSKSRDRNGHMYEAVKGLRDWRLTVHTVAMAAARRTEWSTATTALALDARFYMPRPRSVSAKRRPLPCVKPDLSKLLRAVEDSLVTARVIQDDALIVTTVMQKLYAHEQQPIGAQLTIRTLVAA